MLYKRFEAHSLTGKYSYAISNQMETVNQILPWIQISLSILLVIAILLQRSGAELGGAFGGGEGGGFYHTKRGFEKFLFYLTIVLAILFAVSAFVTIVL